MSRTYSIGCSECQVCLWIAQASGASGSEHTTLYSESHHVLRLREFLFEHRGHSLVFDMDDSASISDMREIEDDAD